MNHQWPDPGEHLWTKWKVFRGMPKPQESRTCLHPDCDAIETRSMAVTQ